MKRDELIQQIKQTVYDIESEAEIILYGSRSRGNAISESDCEKKEQRSGVVSYGPGKRNTGGCSYPRWCRAVECLCEPSLLRLLFLSIRFRNALP